ncbi:hypothetical protein [Oecophyllibacter saccharovorans]|uniref:Uncharacterized protein n=1 Tax=Oecophyllibacter saccharovorans TaxID=2558360 RepID=A0A506URT9_9PROT|nr:hypothetical protein [Oecophyllibacter saccharovorans]TPW35999.1 hypothetical protein E3202_03580 [Oecophyllibacter saccharovorans]
MTTIHENQPSLPPDTIALSTSMLSSHRTQQSVEKVLKEIIDRFDTKSDPLSPREAAQLRRGGSKGMTPEFWRLWKNLSLERYPALPDSEVLSENERQDRWQRVFQAYARFLPTGTAQKQNKRTLPHNSQVSLGEVLWGTDEHPRDGEKHPRVSEQRIAKLLSAPAEKRPAIMMRLLPLLKRGISPKEERFNFIELGKFLLNPDEKACRKIAEKYYR